MLRNRRHVAAVFVLVLLLQFAVPAHAWANTLVTYWPPIGSVPWTGPSDIPNGELDPFHVVGRANAMTFADSNYGWAVGNYLEQASPVSSGALVVSTANGGVLWSPTKLVQYPTQEFRGVAAPTPTDVWVVGDDGLILKRGFSDSYWSAQASGVTTRLNGVAFVSPTTGWAIGASGRILATIDAGTTWAPVPGVPAVEYLGICALDATHVWVVGESGTLAYRNGGAWISTTVAGTTLRSVSFTDSLHGWAVGDLRTFRVTTDGGATWSSLTAPAPLSDPSASPRAVAFSTALRGVAVGGHETAWRTVDGGVTWEVETFYDSAPLNGWGDAFLLNVVRYVPGDSSAVWVAGSQDPLVKPGNPKAGLFNGQLSFPAQFTLTYNHSVGGSITGTTPQVIYSGASGTQVTATPDIGYQFMGWSDAVGTASRTDANVTSDLTVTANFAINTYTLTYAPGAGGTISGTNPQTVNYNASGTPVTALANTGYHFASWSDGYPTAARTDTAVVANKSATANFAIDAAVRYTLTYTAGAGGAISGTSPQSVPSGGSGAAVTAVATTGYHFVNWSDGYPTATRSNTNVRANLTVTANFASTTANWLPVHRFYNFKKGVHFYTASESEMLNVKATLSGTYRYEGVAYQVNAANPANNTPLYRFYNFKKSVHFYTASEDEMLRVKATLSDTYRFEGVAYNVSSVEAPGATKVYRFYNFRQAVHFYTASESEKNDVLAKLSGTYRLEGVAFYLAP